MASGAPSSKAVTSAFDGARTTWLRSPRDAAACRAAARAGSAVSSSGAFAVTTRTGMPQRSRYSPATQPSPPLLPLPQRMTISPAPSTPSKALRASKARKRPARRMSASSGVPASAMACSSATTWGTSSTGGVKGVTASATGR